MSEISFQIDLKSARSNIRANLYSTTVSNK